VASGLKQVSLSGWRDSVDRVAFSTDDVSLHRLRPRSVKRKLALIRTVWEKEMPP
jgi:hypothetical protein